MILVDLFDQVRNFIVSEIAIELAKTFGPMGIIMWLVFHTTRYTLPNMAKTFEDSLQRQRVEFRQMSQQQRNDFRAMISEEQASHETQTNRIVDAISKASSWRRWIG